MSGIHSIPGAVPPPGPGPAAGRPDAGKTDLGTVFGDVLESVDDSQQRSALAIQDLVSGRSHDVLSVISEVAEADLSFKLLIGVRNKMIEAYKQTMNMPI